MPLISITQAATLFDKSSSRRSIIDALEASGSLVFVGMVRRVDADKMNAALPKLKMPREWLQEPAPSAWVGIRDLPRHMPKDYYGVPLDGSSATVRNLLFYGSWVTKAPSHMRTLYNAEHFKNPEFFLGEEERRFRFMHWHLAKKKGSLAAEISKLCLAWEESLQEQRVGVRRATRQMQNETFYTTHLELKKKIADAPWKAKAVVALMKDFSL